MSGLAVLLVGELVELHAYLLGWVGLVWFGCSVSIAHQHFPKYSPMQQVTQNCSQLFREGLRLGLPGVAIGA